MPDPIQAPPQIQKRGPGGCFLWGCLTCAVLLLMFGLAVFLAIRFVKNQVNSFTDSAPAKLPSVQMSDAEYKQLEERTKKFHDAIEEGKETPPLTLSERDLNALMIRNSNNGKMSNHVYVSLKGDQVRAQISVPLPDLPLIRGRYFNGEAGFKVSLTNGVLSVDPQDILVKGKPVPARIKTAVETQMKQMNRELTRDPQNSDAIEKLESLEIKDGQVIIRARPPPPADTPKN